MALSRNLVAGACAGLILGGHLMGAAPVGAAPSSDEQGFVDSTARCASPGWAVAFGRTASSRVAICEYPGGHYQYRGVRMRDGAKLITSAEPTGDGGYVAANDGATYTVTSSSLVVTAGGEVIRDEPMLEFQTPGSSASSDESEASDASDTADASDSSGSTSSAPTETAPTQAAPTQTVSTPTTPLPPPLPAEVGASGSGGS